MEGNETQKYFQRRSWSKMHGQMEVEFNYCASEHSSLFLPSCRRHSSCAPGYDLHITKRPPKTPSVISKWKFVAVRGIGTSYCISRQSPVVIWLVMEMKSLVSKQNRAVAKKRFLSNSPISRHITIRIGWRKSLCVWNREHNHWEV